jgi:hypothetical protein
MLFANKAIRLVSMSTSEADCEYNLSIQRDVVGGYGTRFKTVFLAIRLRLHEMSASAPGTLQKKRYGFTRMTGHRNSSQNGKYINLALAET